MLLFKVALFKLFAQACYLYPWASLWPKALPGNIIRRAWLAVWQLFQVLNALNNTPNKLSALCSASKEELMHLSVCPKNAKANYSNSSKGGGVYILI